MTFLVADGVVPSNEERGYVLRRVMRRAIQQGRSLQMAPGFLTRYAERVSELMGGAYPELGEQREAIEEWLSSEEEGFGRTLEQGMARACAATSTRRARRARDSVPARGAFKLHDTFGFPFELTSELLGRGGPAGGRTGSSELMEEQRARARAARSGGGSGGDDRASVPGASPSGRRPDALHRL